MTNSFIPNLAGHRKRAKKGVESFQYSSQIHKNILHPKSFFILIKIVIISPMSSIHFFIIIFFFFLFKIANFDEIKTEAETAEFNEDEDREYKFSKYFNDGSCAVVDRMKNKFDNPKDTEYSKIDFSQFKCLQEFRRYAMVPKCGDAWYDLKKYCAQVRFYENEEIEQSWLYKKGNEDIIMVILDGCISCEREKFNAKLTLKYRWPSGSFFTKCWDETKKLDQFSIQIDESSKSFTMPAVFYHRKCMGFFSEDSAPTKYEQIKLEVEHNCNDEEKWQKFEVNLPDFSINQVPKDRIAEFHFLELNLHDENENEKAKKYKGPEEDSEKVDPHNAEWDFEPYWKEKQQ